MPVQHDGSQADARKYDTSNRGDGSELDMSYALPVDVPRVTRVTSPIDLGNMSQGEWDQKHGNERGGKSSY